MLKKLLTGLILSVCLLLTPCSLIAKETLTLMLDWFPNVDHLPIYVAKEKGFFAENQLNITIISPSETSDGLKLAASGNIDLAVSYQPQAIIAADNGLALKVVAPLVVHPLTTLLYLDDKAIKHPSDLSGKKIGYTVPGLMDVILDAFASINKVENYTPVNVGFTILPSLIAKRVEAVMGPFKTYETVTIAQHGYKAHFFELEKWGIPDYEELIFVTSPKTLAAKKTAIRGFVSGLEKALAYTKAHPDDALTTYLSAVPQADKATETKAFALTLPYFAETIVHDPDRWRLFADFALKYGLIKNRVDTRQIIHTW